MWETAEPYVWVAGGLGLLLIGGDFVVRGAVCLARDIGVSELLIGLVVVAFGTSSPELIVALQAASQGSPDIAMGNVVGSNIANILLVLGLGALLFPIPVNRRAVVTRDGIVALAASAFLLYLGYEGVITFWAGIVLVSALVIYILFSYITERRQLSDATATRVDHFKTVNGGTVIIHVGTTLLGFAALMYGAHLLIEGAVDVATRFGVSEAVIAVSVVAVGTSVPELAAVCAAAWRQSPEVAIGSIVGSNIFNIMAVLGITAIVMPIQITASFAAFDLWVMVGVIIIFLVFLTTERKLTRYEGLLMLAAYAGYIGVLYSGKLPITIP